MSLRFLFGAALLILVLSACSQIPPPATSPADSPAQTVNHFWFSWAAFRPNTRVYQP